MSNKKLNILIINLTSWDIKSNELKKQLEHNLYFESSIKNSFSYIVEKKVDSLLIYCTKFTKDLEGFLVSTKNVKKFIITDLKYNIIKNYYLDIKNNIQDVFFLQTYNYQIEEVYYILKLKDLLIKRVTDLETSKNFMKSFLIKNEYIFLSHLLNKEKNICMKNHLNLISLKIYKLSLKQNLSLNIQNKDINTNIQKIQKLLNKEYDNNCRNEIDIIDYLQTFKKVIDQTYYTSNLNILIKNNLKGKPIDKKLKTISSNLNLILYFLLKEAIDLESNLIIITMNAQSIKFSIKKKNSNTALNEEIILYINELILENKKLKLSYNTTQDYLNIFIC